jgi:hypothetical protein
LWLRVGARGSRVTVLGRRVREASDAVVVVGRVQLLLGRVDGRVQWVRVQEVPSHHILVCPVLVPFEVSRKGSRVGVGKDIMQLRQNVSGIGLKRLLRNCPVCHENNNVYCWKTGKGERVARNQR